MLSFSHSHSHSHPPQACSAKRSLSLEQPLSLEHPSSLEQPLSLKPNICFHNTTVGCSSPCAETMHSSYGSRTRSGNPRIFNCPQCDRAFTREEHLSRHTISTHNKLKPFSCGICLRAFSRRDLLLRHAKNLHGGSEFAVMRLRKFKIPNGGNDGDGGGTWNSSSPHIQSNASNKRVHYAVPAGMPALIGSSAGHIQDIDAIRPHPPTLLYGASSAGANYGASATATALHADPRSLVEPIYLPPIAGALAFPPPLYRQDHYSQAQPRIKQGQLKMSVSTLVG